MRSNIASHMKVLACTFTVQYATNYKFLMH